MGANVAHALKQLLRHIEPRTRARWRARTCELARCSLDQVERQLLKLQDVHRVQRHGSEHPLLSRLAAAEDQC
jgi:DNA-binding TFAR19-related protein (PDSD5 family)